MASSILCDPWGWCRGHSVAGLLPANLIEPDDIELPLIHYNTRDYKQAIRDREKITENSQE